VLTGMGGDYLKNKKAPTPTIETLR
jgi:hypothetical protein